MCPIDIIPKLHKSLILILSYEVSVTHRRDEQEDLNVPEGQERKDWNDDKEIDKERQNERKIQMVNEWMSGRARDNERRLKGRNKMNETKTSVSQKERSRAKRRMERARNKEWGSRVQKMRKKLKLHTFMNDDKSLETFFCRFNNLGGGCEWISHCLLLLNYFFPINIFCYIQCTKGHHCVCVFRLKHCAQLKIVFIQMSSLVLRTLNLCFRDEMLHSQAPTIRQKEGHLCVCVHVWKRRDGEEGGH